jgi:hypothetical protein
MIKGEGDDISMAKDMGVNQGREEIRKKNPQKTTKNMKMN